MSRKLEESRKMAELRWRAEEIANGKGVLAEERREVISPRDMRQSLHELRVHQIELEMQNEELNRVQAELDTARARYFDLYDLAPVGYFVVSTEGLIVEANLTAVTLLGIPRASLVKQPITRFIHKEDQDIYYLQRKRFLETGNPYACDLRMVKADGSVFWAHLAATGARDPLSGPGHEEETIPVNRVVLSDITERKAAEALKARLEEQLQQAEKLRTVGVLAGGVAHDFNNLLTVILGNANLALMVAGPEAKLAPYFEAIEKASMKAADLTQQLLSYAGNEKIVPRQVDINVVIKEILQIIAASIPGNVRIDCELAEGLPFVEGDSSRIFQILMNLVMNALEAIPEAGAGLVSIRTQAEEVEEVEEVTLRDEPWALPMAAGRYVTVEVVDSGVGMTPEVVERAFDPFFTTKFTGRGLGLAAVIGILSSHGGGIRVRSEPGNGASFKIFLPAMA